MFFCLFSKFNCEDWWNFLFDFLQLDCKCIKTSLCNPALFFTGGQSDQGYGSKDELIKDDAEIHVPEEQVARELITKIKVQTEG